MRHMLFKQQQKPDQPVRREDLAKLLQVSATELGQTNTVSTVLHRVCVASAGHPSCAVLYCEVSLHV